MPRPSLTLGLALAAVLLGGASGFHRPAAAPRAAVSSTAAAARLRARSALSASRPQWSAYRSERGAASKLALFGDAESGEEEGEVGAAQKEEQTLQERVASGLIELGRSFAKTALAAGVTVLVLYLICLELTHVQVYGVQVVEMNPDIFQWKIMGVPASLFAVSAGYFIFRAVRIVVSLVRLLVLVPALGGGLMAASQVQDASQKLSSLPFAKEMGLVGPASGPPSPWVVVLPEVVTLVEGLLISAAIGGVLYFAGKLTSTVFGGKEKE